jgi:hypothetical protein
MFIFVVCGKWRKKNKLNIQFFDGVFWLDVVQCLPRITPHETKKRVQIYHQNTLTKASTVGLDFYILHFDLGKDFATDFCSLCLSLVSLAVVGFDFFSFRADLLVELSFILTDGEFFSILPSNGKTLTQSIFPTVYIYFSMVKATRHQRQTSHKEKCVECPLGYNFFT